LLPVSPCFDSFILLNGLTFCRVLSPYGQNAGESYFLHSPATALDNVEQHIAANYSTTFSRGTKSWGLALHGFFSIAASGNDMLVSLKKRGNVRKMCGTLMAEIERQDL
jgi:hypothetical protein